MTTSSDLGSAELRQHIDVTVLETIQAGVRVARTRCLHEVWHDDGDLADREYDAAERYRADYERASGAASRSDAVARLPPWQQGHPSEMQVVATTRLRVAQQAIGLLASRLIEAACCHGAGLNALADLLHCRKATARQRLVDALVVLADHDARPRHA